MKIPTILTIAIAFLLLTSCERGDHFITDKNYRRKVEAQFEKQKELAKKRSAQLFSIFDQKLPLAEKEALRFLYAYMPLSDLADYDGEFYLKNVRATLSARDTFSWGKQVPEELFRHFVLPIRVNNENLDSSRWIFFAELKDRVRKMSMKKAALEVNHWCHEKVTYRGTDIRTSSPLATVKTAYGRCGEESTFTVAALRSVGIPARQCYTPRWAHGDDNHAWVEVWVDGKWHYMGACEPEYDLDMAWFTGPAKRAMLVNTNVFGDYEGPEDVLVKDQRYTRINILSNYANTKRIFVKITDSLNNPLDSATVEFQLYNYAEFYPLTKCFTAKEGLCSFLTGYGDLIVWAAKDKRYGYRKVTIANTDTAVIQLSMKPGKEYFESFDLVPPTEIKAESEGNDSLKKINSERFAFEDKLRAGYEQTFIDSAKTFRLANNLKVNSDTLWKILSKTRGNWRQIIDFITQVPPEKKRLIFPLLFNISEKDLHDATVEVLTDNILHSEPSLPEFSDRMLFDPFILDPRIDNEYLKPYKQLFREKFGKRAIDSAVNNPLYIYDWIKKNIRIDHNANYGRAPITPVGVFELRIADDHSRDLLFVALCRSFGIPARLETATRIPQYFQKGKWIDVWFENKPAGASEKGVLVLTNDPKNDRKPEYYIHFTVEKFTDGYYRSLDYETDPVMQHFPATVELSPDNYLLVTGNRITGGTVLANIRFFNIEAGRKIDLPIILRKNRAPLPLYGNLTNTVGLIGHTDGELMPPGLTAIVAFLEPDKEPSRHFIADLILKKKEFAQWKGRIVLLFRNETEKNSFLQKNRKELPSNVRCSQYAAGCFNLLSSVTKKNLGQNLPVILYLNTRREINYLSEGYKIGIGDELLQLITRETGQK